MSAWIVTKGHIDALVQAMIVEGLVEMTDAQAVGQMLWHENHLSIQARYGDLADTPDYTPEMIEAPLGDHHIKAALDCYDYQTCEHDGYGASEAYRLVVALSTLLVERNGGVETFANDKAHPTKWGYNSVSECVA